MEKGTLTYVDKDKMHTDKCEACGNNEIAWFDKQGHYVLCQMCRDTMVNILMGHLQSAPAAISRFARIV